MEDFTPLPALLGGALIDIDAPLLLGAAIFGVGWGLAGLCPGPAVTALASGRLAAAAFVLAMLAGMGVARPLAAGLARRASRRPRRPPLRSRAVPVPGEIPRRSPTQPASG